MNTDPLSDMIIRLKNAQAAGRPSALVPFSELKWAVAETLKKAGYLKALAKKGKKTKKFI